MRIARACREMRIASVLAHVEADDVRYTRRFFNEAISIPSYLDVNAVNEEAPA